MRFSHVLMRDSIYEATPGDAAASPSSRDRRGVRGRSMPRSPEPHLGGARPPLSARREIARGREGDPLRVARRRPGRVPARVRGGRTALRERPAISSRRWPRTSETELRAAAGARRGAEPRRRSGLARRRTPSPARPPCREGRVARPARAGGPRLRREVRLGARGQRPGAGPAARACPGGGGRRRTAASARAGCSRRLAPAIRDEPRRERRVRLAERGGRDGAADRRSRDARLRSRRAIGSPSEGPDNVATHCSRRTS